MADPMDTFEARLLDWHLGQLDDAEAQTLKQELEASPALQAKSDHLAALLGLLEQNAAPEPPADLNTRILSAVDALEAETANETTTLQDTAEADRHPILSFHETPRETVPGERIGGFIPRYLAWRDMLAIAACIVLFIGIAVPGYFKAQSVATRHRCLNNLRQIYTGLDNYAQANANVLPFLDYVPEGTWRRDGMDGRPVASNTRHVYRLLEQGYTPDPNIFVCPAAPNGKPMARDDIQRHHDFPHPTNNSYSFVFLNTPEGRRLAVLKKDPKRQMVLAADRNPHLADDLPARIARRARNLANSPLHDNGAGQNVIYPDGRGGWYTTPNVGVAGDDIYRAGELKDYTGTEKPQSETDTFLVP